MDFRLRPSVLARLLEIEGYWESDYDLVSVAGSAKDFLSDKAEEVRFLVKQVTRAVEFHRIREVVILLHDDCRAYGINDGDAERHAQESDLRQIAAALREVAPQLEVRSYRIVGTDTGQLRLELFTP
jgi:hypothetical protein